MKVALSWSFNHIGQFWAITNTKAKIGIAELSKDNLAHYF